VLGFQFVLHKLIQLVHVYVRKELRGQVADGYASRMEQIALAGRKAAYDFSQEPHDLLVFDSLPQYLQENLVVDTVKEFSHVALQRIAGTCAVSTYRAEHLRQSLDAFVRTLADATGKGIGNKTGLKRRIELLKDGMVQYPVTHSRLVDVAQLGVGNIESGVKAMLVCFISQVAVQLKNMLLHIALEVHHVRFVAFLFLKLIPCPEQVLGRGHALEYSLVRFHI